jgi:hypothetical protein
LNSGCTGRRLRIARFVVDHAGDVRLVLADLRRVVIGRQVLPVLGAGVAPARLDEQLDAERRALLRRHGEDPGLGLAGDGIELGIGVEPVLELGRVAVGEHAAPGRADVGVATVGEAAGAALGVGEHLLRQEIELVQVPERRLVAAHEVLDVATRRSRRTRNENRPSCCRPCRRRSRS